MNEKLFWVGTEESNSLGPKLLMAPVWCDGLIAYLRSQGIADPELVAEKLATYFRTLTKYDPTRQELELMAREMRDYR